ncbi:MAG: phosphoenolpyruvate carboxylase, partial [Chloroflexota bacterium]
ARSDPALNYGVVSASLLAKLALQRLHHLELRIGVPIYPIIGVGGVPFRGNFRPGRVGRLLESYPSVQTFTVQSSFKYDYPPADVIAAVGELMAHQRTSPLPIDEPRALDVVSRFTRRYQEQVAGLAKLVNTAAAYVPQRRDRRLHNGLFGYSRTSGDNGEGVHLPRAITFCAALYSLGIPPELLGLDALTSEDLSFLQDAMPHYTSDLADALRFANEGNIELAMGRPGLETLYRFQQGVDLEHRGITTLVGERIRTGFDEEQTRSLVEWASKVRGFLG